MIIPKSQAKVNGLTTHIRNKAIVETIIVINVAGTGFFFFREDSPNIQIMMAAPMRSARLAQSTHPNLTRKPSTISITLLAASAK